jgi:hypothetical protein
VVLAEYALGDVVWVQDYHLMILPSLLKQAVVKVLVNRVNSDVLALTPSGLSLLREPSARGSRCPGSAGV